MKRTRFPTRWLAAIAAATLALGAAQPASAASLTEVSFWWAPNDTRTELRDTSGQNVYESGQWSDTASGWNDGAQRSAGDSLAIGDVLAGVFKIESSRARNEQTGAFVESGTDYINPTVTGVFAIEIVNILTPGSDATIFFGPTAGFDNGDGTMVRIYEDSSNAFSGQPDVWSNVEDFRNGTLAFEIGFEGTLDPSTGVTDAGEFWQARGSSNLEDVPGSSEGIGAANFALNRTTTDGIGGGWDLILQETVFGTLVEFTGTSRIFATDLGVWSFEDDANFSYVTPTPAAALPGLAMFGLLALARPLRRRTRKES